MEATTKIGLFFQSACVSEQFLFTVMNSSKGCLDRMRDLDDVDAYKRKCNKQKVSVCTTIKMNAVNL